MQNDEGQRTGKETIIEWRRRALDCDDCKKEIAIYDALRKIASTESSHLDKRRRDVVLQAAKLRKNGRSILKSIIPIAAVVATAICFWLIREPIGDNDNLTQSIIKTVSMEPDLAWNVANTKKRRKMVKKMAMLNLRPSEKLVRNTMSEWRLRIKRRRKRLKKYW